MSAGAHEEDYELEDAINDYTNEEERKEYTKDAFAIFKNISYSGVPFGTHRQLQIKVNSPKVAQDWPSNVLSSNISINAKFCT